MQIDKHSSIYDGQVYINVGQIEKGLNPKYWNDTHKYISNGIRDKFRVSFNFVWTISVERILLTTYT